MKKRNLIGENIHRLRIEAGLTQEELALKSGLSQGYINQLENGKRKFTQKSLELISKALSVPMIDFFKGKKAFHEPVVREETVEYDCKTTPHVKDFAVLLKQLPPDILRHYYVLLSMEVEVRNNQKRKKP